MSLSEDLLTGVPSSHFVPTMAFAYTDAPIISAVNAPDTQLNTSTEAALPMMASFATNSLAQRERPDRSNAAKDKTDPDRVCHRCRQRHQKVSIHVVVVFASLPLPDCCISHQCDGETPCNRCRNTKGHNECTNRERDRVTNLNRNDNVAVGQN